jgi:hypothetical protein
MHQRPRKHWITFTAFAAAAIAPGLAVAAALDSTGPSAQLAYVDPGSGSFILQALVAALAGAAVAMNAYWARIKQFFGRGTSEEDDDSVDAPPNDD